MDSLIRVMVDVDVLNHIPRRSPRDVDPVPLVGHRIAVVVRFDILDPRILDPSQSKTPLKPNDLEVADLRASRLLTESHAGTRLGTTSPDQVSTTIKHDSSGQGEAMLLAGTQIADQFIVPHHMVATTTHHSPAALPGGRRTNDTQLEKKC